MLRAFCATDIGRNRQCNQDYFSVSEEPVGNLPNLFVVADGMGGHRAGGYASQYAVTTILEQARDSYEKNPIAVLEKAIQTANERILERSRTDENLAGMGTTVVAATCLGRYLEVANVGDSRLYISHRDYMEQITRDHSLVEEMVRFGGINREEARRHPDKNIITRAVGVEEKVTIDFFTVELTEGDLVLLCSDGLTNMLEDGLIHQILREDTDITGKAEELISRANENGGRDNITVILVEPFADEVSA